MPGCRPFSPQFFCQPGACSWPFASPCEAEEPHAAVALLSSPASWLRVLLSVVLPCRARVGAVLPVLDFVVVSVEATVAPLLCVATAGMTVDCARQDVVPRCRAS